MNAKAESLLRQQYLVPRRSVKKLQEMSRKEGVSTGELARGAIEAYTSGRVLSESEEETAARALLAEIHGAVRDVLKRIDASLAEVRERERAFDKVEKVVVRWLEHSGQYGRTTLGGDGAEADAVILSQLTGTPVQVQWTLQEDLAWSTVSPGWVSDIDAALDTAGNITAVRTAFCAPHMFRPRPLGSLLTDMPCSSSRPGSWIATQWPYDKIRNRLEQAYGMPNLGAGAVSAGLRGHIMRTPGQRQQNFVLEAMLNEAAAASKADPVQLRIRHTTQQRLIDVLKCDGQGCQMGVAASATLGRAQEWK